MLEYECEYKKSHPDYVPFSIPDEVYDGQDAGSPAYVASAYVDMMGAGLGAWGLIAGAGMMVAGVANAATVLAFGAATTAVFGGRLAYKFAREFRKGDYA